MSRYKHSYEGGGELLRAEFLLVAMVAKAEKVKLLAEATSPVDETGPHPGRYKASWKIETEKHGGNKKDRVVARVVNTAPEALYVEYGTRSNPRHSTARRALAAARD